MKLPIAPKMEEWEYKCTKCGGTGEIVCFGCGGKKPNVNCAGCGGTGKAKCRNCNK